MSWRSWLVSCLAAGLVGVVLGSVHAGLTGSGVPTGRSGSAPAAEVAGLPVPREQAAVRTPPPAAVGAVAPRVAAPDQRGGAGEAKSAKQPKAGKHGKSGKHHDERNDGDDRGGDDRDGDDRGRDD